MSKKQNSPAKPGFFADFGLPEAIPVRVEKSAAKSGGKVPVGKPGVGQGDREKEQTPVEPQ